MIIISGFSEYTEVMVTEIKTEKLDLENIGRFLETKGYKIKKLSQPWRHVVGEVLHENERLFFKLGSTKEISEKTRNEKHWNENINTVWKKNINNFKSPKIFDEGNYEDKYWFVCEFVFGKPLAEVGKPSKELNHKDFEKAADIASELVNIGEKTILPNDSAQILPSLIEKYYTKAKEWTKNTKSNTKELIQFIEENKKDIFVGSSHGDFTPWALMKTKNKQIYLIDGESSHLMGVKHYDAAYFYHRVYTKLKRPDLAKLFITRYFKLRNFDKVEEKSFDAILASRIVGGYFDAERDGVTSVELNRQMETELLKK